MRSAMCSDCPHRMAPIPSLILPEPIHPCHQQPKVVCLGSTVNQKAIEAGKSLSGDIVKFNFEPSDVVPEIGKTYKWYGTTQD